MNVLNIAFYQFKEVSDPSHWKVFFHELASFYQLRGSILLSNEGINGSLSGKIEDVRTFQKKFHEAWSGVEFKESLSHHISFRRLVVKVKNQIIAFSEEVAPHVETGDRVSPKELKKWLDEGRDVQLLDTRNTYEIAEGAFHKASDFGLRHFRDFPNKLRQSSLSKENVVVMYCTGGIRCEKATALAKKEGFKKVYQLDGGILKYFEECEGAHYNGNCFVFDQRGSVNPKLKPALNPGD